MPKFYDYMMTAELAENPYTSPPDVTTDNHCLYFNEDNVGEPGNAPRGVNILRERVGS